MPLFDSDFLEKLEYLSLVSRRVFRGQVLAQRRAMRLGSGIEFADHRDYTAGDDFRLLDWNVYARHEVLLLKRFQEEEDLPVYLLLDCSRSMGFGTPAKFDLARQVTAALAYIALADLDRVAVTAFGGSVSADFPLARGKGRVLGLLAFLETLRPQDALTDLAHAITGFLQRARRRGLAVVVSDLYDPAGFQRGLDLLRHHRHEPHVIQVYDRREAEPELLGDMQLVDAETEHAETVTVRDQHLRRYREVFQEFLGSVRGYCRDHGLSYTPATTDVAFHELILGMMRATGTVR